MAVAIYDRPVATELLASIAVHLESCYPIGRNGRPIGYSTKYPGVDRDLVKELRRKRIAAPVMRGSL